MYKLNWRDNGYLELAQNLSCNYKDHRGPKCEQQRQKALGKAHAHFWTGNKYKVERAEQRMPSVGAPPHLFMSEATRLHTQQITGGHAQEVVPTAQVLGT